MIRHDGRVSTVVISRNRRQQLLRSLGRHEAPVVVVDNGSTDGTAQAVRAHLPHVQVVALEENLGALGRNIGVQHTRTPYVAFADDDSWWAEGSLAACAEVFDHHPRLGLVAARMLVGPEQRLDPLCEVMARSPLRGRPGAPGTPILGFMSCGAVVRRDAFLAAGGFDDVTFFVGEEDRLAWDIAADGWQLAYLPDIVAYHHPTSGLDRSGRQRLAVRNAILTATMRRPWRIVLAELATAVGSGWEGIGGALDALPRLRRALARRTSLPSSLETQIRMLRT